MENAFPPIPYNESQRKYMLIIYVLFAISLFFGGITAIVAVIIAYVKRDEMRGTIYQDHISFLLRTFWASIGGMVVGFILAFIGIGALVMLAVSIWYIFRVVVGAIRFWENKSITPTGWLM